MTEGGFFQPMAAALELLRRVSAILTWVLLIGMAVALRALVALPHKPADVSTLLILELIATWGAALISAGLIFALARTLIAPQAAAPRPLYARFVGLVVAYGVINRAVSGIGRTLIFFNDLGQFARTYGSVLLGSFISIVTFPFLVRALSAAAGLEAPRLGGMVAFAFDQGRFAYLWYALCAILFPVLMVYTFEHLLAAGSQANALPGNFVQSAITGTGGVIHYMLAVVVARWTIPDTRQLAETFA